MKNITRVLYFLLFTLFFSYQGHSQLSAGDVVVIGLNVDGAPEELALLALTDITTSETFYITDYPVTSAGGTTLDTSNGTNGSMSITPTSTITAGTIFTVSISGSSGGVSVSGASVSTTFTGWTSTTPASGAGDSFHIFQGGSLTSPTTFIYAFSNSSAMTTNLFDPGVSLSSTESYLGKDLAIGTDALALTGSDHLDNVYYSGVVSGDAATLLGLITSKGNYLGDNTTTHDITVDGSSIFNGGAVTTNPGFTVSGGCAAPTAQATAASFGTATSSTLTLTSFTAPAGGADGYAVYIRDTNSFTAPADGTSSGANTVWGDSGQQLVFIGTSASPNVTVTGLDSGTQYFFQVYAYNDCSGTETYETTGLNTNVSTSAIPSFSINDPSVSEGDAGSTTLTFTVSLDSPAPAGGATVDFATSDGTASSSSDYTSTTGTVSFSVGETSKTIDVTISGDEVVEVDETITMTLSNPTGTSVVIGDPTGSGTITNDDSATVTIANVAVNENDGTATVTLTLDNAVDGGFSVDVSTADNTATTADGDYTAVTSATETFAGTASETETFTITLGGDTKVEADELIDIAMSNLVPATVDSGDITITDTAQVTITNDDSATVTIANVTVNEDDGTATVTLTLDNAVDGGFDLGVSTADNTATTADGDYAPLASALETFAGTASETETVTIIIGIDTKVEADELIDIAMNNLVPATVDSGDITITDTATVTITNDDSATVTIANVAVNENDGTATITLTLDNAVDGGFDVDVSTADNTATTADGDYTAVTSATETFAGTASETETFTITIGGDTKVEADELVDIAMSNLVPATVDSGDIDITDAAQLTITNDDSATVTIANVTVNENDGTATITLTLDNAVDGGFDVDVSTADGTATTADGDYTAVTSATETFAGTASETETFTITLGGDTKVEADETLTISMSGLSPATVAGGDIDITDGATLTLNNDDSAIVTIANVSGNEDDGAITVTVTLDNAVDGGFDVDVSTADGTATTADSDYTSVTNQTLTFAGTAGESETFTVTPTADVNSESNETVSISMSNKSPASVASANIDITDGATVTILNDDDISASINDPSVSEGDAGSTTLTFTVSLDSPAPAGGATVDFATSDGTASSASDYTSTTGTVSFSVGETSKTIDVTISGDEVVEVDETITMTLSNPTGTSVVIGDPTGSGTITNDDSATVTIANVAVNENDGTATVTLTLDNAVDGGFSVDVSTADNTATTADGDYTAVTSATETFAGTASETETFTITLGGDTKVEADELIDIAMSNLVPATVDSGDITITDTAQVTITNDDSATVTIANVTVNEDDGTATVTLTLDNAVDGGFDLGVSTADNTATTADGDYAPLASALETFAGTASETETATIIIGIDTKVEADELIDIAMNNLVPATVDSGDITITDTATVTITNDDSATVTIANVAVNENDGTATITLTLDNAVDGGFDVDVSTADNTATTADGDYTAVTSATETFAGTASETETFTITIGGDTKVEADELVDIAMSNLVPATVDSGDIDITDAAQLTITNDDSATVTIANVSANENSGAQIITATLSNPVQGGFAFDVFTTDGTATVADSDYSSTAGSTLTFLGTAGETQTLNLQGLGDTKVEADETFSISMTNVGFTTVDPTDIDVSSVATYTILNDDSAVVTIEDVTVNEGDLFAAVTLTLDNAVQGGFFVDLSTADGTATSANDYSMIGAATEIFAGTAGEARVVNVGITDDMIGEDTESFTVSLSNLISSTVSASSIDITDGATVTILDDDAPVLVSTTPMDDAVDVAIGTNLTITYNQNVSVGTGSILIKDRRDDSLIESIDVTGLGVSIFEDTVTIDPSSDLPSETDIYVEVPAGAFENGSGQGNDAISGNTAWDFTTEDITSPTVVLSTTTSSPTNLAFTVTITFSEAVTNFDLTDITVTNGVASIFNQLNPVTYSVLVTPATDGEVTVSILAAALQDVSSNSNDNEASNVLSITYDITKPVIVITTDAPTDPTNAPFTATFTVTEDLADFEAADIVLTNANISDFVTVSPSLYTATITPIADGTVTLDIPADDLEDNAGNGNEPATFSIEYDATRPTTVIASAAADPTNVAFDITIIFSEDVTGFDVTDITVANGDASNLAAISASEYTATITPTADGTVTIDIAADVAMDDATNGNDASNQLSIEYDATRPTVVITSDAPDPTNVAFTATFTFSEDVTGFDISDIEVENGTPSDFTEVSASLYTATITPDSDGTVNIDIAENVAEDAATNGNEAAIQYSVEYDATRPTVVISSMAIDPINGAFDITITFDEDVTGFDLSDITVVNGAASNFGTTSASVYTATITPTVDGNVTVEVAENVAEDAATNGNEGSDVFEIVFDGTRPTVVVSSMTIDPTNAPFDVTITFSEDVTGFELADIDVGNGTASNLMGTGSIYTATITPTADGGVIVFIPEDVAEDSATNGNDISNEYFIEYDATNPTATITTLAPSPVNVPFDIDIEFSEDVFGFEMADLVVTNGAPSGFTVNSATSYTVTITPTGAGDVIVDIPAAVTEDLATNPNDAATFSIEYDNIPPLPPQITHISEYTCSGDVSQTGDNTLEISGTAERESTVEMFIDGISIGTVVTDAATGFFTFDYTGTILADGSYVFTAQSTDIAMNTGSLSSPFAITINTVDTDGDGDPDFCDDDDDGNGSVDAEEDCDGDGIVDSQDTDNSSCRAPIDGTRSYGFSPNGDGINDGWFIENITAFPNNVVSVYSRSGKLVFKQANYQNDWQAESNQISSGGLGSRLPVGPYIYLIDLGDGGKPVRGWLYINY